MEGRLTILVPVYNEAENFPHFWSELEAAVSSDYEAIVIYDDDADTTVPVVEELVARGARGLRLEKNNIRPGVAGAIETGFRMVDRGPVVVAMADLSDDLTRIEPMLELYRRGCHLVAASRYMPGGKIIGGPWLKKSLSRLAGWSLYWLRGLPTRDATNAFKLYDAAMLHSIPIESVAGFEINLEVTVKAFLAGYRIAEIPTTWRDRTRGASRFRLWNWLPRYLKWYLFAFRRKRPTDRSGLV
jgi:dolichol-phosphate mannosyltransferase